MQWNKSSAFTRTFVFGILALTAVHWVAPEAQAQTNADTVLVEMSQAFRRGDKRMLAQLLPRTAGHPLEGWAAYWELKARLDEAQADEVQRFFQRWAGTYVEDRLRAEWLQLLGQRRDWTNFKSEFPAYRMRDEREVMCYAAVIELAAEPSRAPEIAETVKRNWYALRDADDGCALAADRLHEAKALKNADIWLKARMAMEANRVRAATRAVEIVDAAASAQVAEAAQAPARFLARSSSGRIGHELQVLALIRLAATDVDAAAAALERIAERLSPQQRSYAWGAIGKQANLKLDARAHDWFAQAADGALSDDLLGWKVRAALRSGTTPAWRTVLSATAAMSDAARNEPTWSYWRARALAATGDAAAARSIYERIAGVRSFYEMLALDELGQRVSVPSRPAPVTDAEREAARLNAGLNRALYAITIGLRPEGVREWNYTTNLHTPGGMNDRERLAAAQFACERQVWDRCINTSERTSREVFDHEQRFPMPFRDAVIKRTSEIGLDAAYVYGLIRQESRFILDARSHVGASGLMQLMPATARWTANKIGLTGFKPSDVNDRDINIALGTAYLKLVLDDFGGVQPLASAAYNAGPNRPRVWRNGPTMEAAAWAENIPFLETRDYVKNVAANATMYAAILSGQPQSLKARLGRVGPRDASAPEVNKELP